MSGGLRGFGLHIVSAMPVRGATAGVAIGRPDIVIDRGTTPAWTPGTIDGPYRAASPDLFDFTMPDLARFTCLDRRRIVVDTMPGADPEHVADMLIATALPALLWARGGVVLHAAAAIFPGEATARAVAGASGAGKSTWLAEAVAIGARSLADDALHIRIDDGRIMASGLPGGYFRRAECNAEQRTFTAVPPDRQVAEHILGAITVLSPGTEAPVALSGAAAVAALLRQRHRPRIATLLSLEGAALATIAGIARALPITLQPRNQPVKT